MNAFFQSVSVTLVLVSSVSTCAQRPRGSWWGKFDLPWRYEGINYSASDVTTRTFEEKKKQPSLDRRFVLRIGNGSGFDGYETLVIDSQGEAYFIFMTRKPRELAIWRKARIAVDMNKIEALRDHLRRNRVLDFEKGYSNSICDGAQCYISIIEGPRRQSTFFSNHFPKQFQNVAEFCAQEFLNPNPQVFKEAVIVDSEAAEAEHDIAFPPNPAFVEYMKAKEEAKRRAQAEAVEVRRSPEICSSSAIWYAKRRPSPMPPCTDEGWSSGRPA